MMEPPIANQFSYFTRAVGSASVSNAEIVAQIPKYATPYQREMIASYVPICRALIEQVRQTKKPFPPTASFRNALIHEYDLKKGVVDDVCTMDAKVRACPHFHVDFGGIMAGVTFSLAMSAALLATQSYEYNEDLRGRGKDLTGISHRTFRRQSAEHAGNATDRIEDVWVDLLRSGVALGQFRSNGGLIQQAPAGNQAPPSTPVAPKARVGSALPSYVEAHLQIRAQRANRQVSRLDFYEETELPIADHLAGLTPRSSPLDATFARERGKTLEKDVARAHDAQKFNVNSRRSMWHEELLWLRTRTGFLLHFPCPIVDSDNDSAARGTCVVCLEHVRYLVRCSLCGDVMCKEHFEAFHSAPVFKGHDNYLPSVLSPIAGEPKDVTKKRLSELSTVADTVAERKEAGFIKRRKSMTPAAPGSSSSATPPFSSSSSSSSSASSQPGQVGAPEADLSTPSSQPANADNDDDDE